MGENWTMGVDLESQKDIATARTNLYSKEEAEKKYKTSFFSPTFPSLPYLPWAKLIQNQGDALSRSQFPGHRTGQRRGAGTNGV